MAATSPAQPPGPPLDHRIATADVQAMLQAHAWKVEASVPIGQFSYLLVAARP